MNNVLQEDAYALGLLPMEPAECMQRAMQIRRVEMTWIMDPRYLISDIQGRPWSGPVQSYGSSREHVEYDVLHQASLSTMAPSYGAYRVVVLSHAVQSGCSRTMEYSIPQDHGSKVWVHPNGRSE